MLVAVVRIVDVVLVVIADIVVTAVLVLHYANKNEQTQRPVFLILQFESPANGYAGCARKLLPCTPETANKHHRTPCMCRNQDEHKTLKHRRLSSSAGVAVLSLMKVQKKMYLEYCT